MSFAVTKRPSGLLARTQDAVGVVYSTIYFGGRWWIWELLASFGL